MDELKKSLPSCNGLFKVRYCKKRKIN